MTAAGLLGDNALIVVLIPAVGVSGLSMKKSDPTRQSVTAPSDTSRLARTLGHRPGLKGLESRRKLRR